MKKRSFRATVIDGKVKWVSPKTVIAYCSTIKGEDIKITFEKWTAPLTDPQRKYYFGVCLAYMINESEAFAGYTKDELHLALKVKLLTDPEETLPKIPSLKRMTKDEMREYIEKVQQFAAEFGGVVIPDAKETGE